MLYIRRSLFGSKLITRRRWGFKFSVYEWHYESPWICRRNFVFPSRFALLSFPTCSPFYRTDYHHKPDDFLSFHLCFSSKYLKAPQKTCEKIDLPSKLVWQVSISDQSATALMKARENKTHVSLSRILAISRPFYFMLLGLNNKSLIVRSSVQYRGIFLLVSCILTRPTGTPMTRKNKFSRTEHSQLNLINISYFILCYQASITSHL